MSILIVQRFTLYLTTNYCVLNEITDFNFKGGPRDYDTVYNSRAFWSKLKSKTGGSCSLQKIMSCLEFLINNSFFQVGSKIFCQVIGIPMGWIQTFFYDKRATDSCRNGWNVQKVQESVDAIMKNWLYRLSLMPKQSCCQSKKWLFELFHLCAVKSKILP